MPAWTPASIASALWLDFSDTSKLFDATSGGSAVTNGVGIARAEDKSGNGRHFTQSTAGARPTYTTGLQNSLGGAVFDGGDSLSHSTASTWTFLHSAQSTIFIVQKSGTVADPTAVYAWLGNNGGTSSNIGAFFGYDDRNVLTGMTDSFNCSCTAGAGVSVYAATNNSASAMVTDFRNVLTPNTHQLCTITSDPTNATAASRVKLAVNGGTLVGNNERTGTASGSAPTFNLQIGETNGVGRMVGNILEIVILNYAASTDIRQQMEGYLAWKWGLQGSLPSDHPWKSFRPIYGASGLINSQSLVGRGDLVSGRQLVGFST